MKKIKITCKLIENYLQELRLRERSEHTIEKYKRELYEFKSFIGNSDICKENILQWKNTIEGKYCPSGVNGRLVAVNGLLSFAGRYDLRTKLLKIQKEIFAKDEKELTKEEYKKLVKAAERNGNMRLSLVIQTICATGIRVSELQYITVDTARSGRTEVKCKGKRRVILLPVNLQKKLRFYTRKMNINEGCIFITRNGRPMNRSNIWHDMKKLCEEAGVHPDKVFPHNLRHLFARTFYNIEKDIAKLADILGHSSIETTRIYIMESGKEHQRKLEKMGLVI